MLYWSTVPVVWGVAKFQGFWNCKHGRTGGYGPFNYEFQGRSLEEYEAACNTTKDNALVVHRARFGCDCEVA